MEETSKKVTLKALKTNFDVFSISHGIYSPKSLTTNVRSYRNLVTDLKSYLVYLFLNDVTLTINRLKVTKFG